MQSAPSSLRFVLSSTRPLTLPSDEGMPQSVTPGGVVPFTYPTGGQLCPRTTLDIEEKRNISICDRNQTSVPWLSSLQPSHYTNRATLPMLHIMCCLGCNVHLNYIYICRGIQTVTLTPHVAVLVHMRYITELYV